MHLLGTLTGNVDDAVVARKAAQQQLITPPLSAFRIAAPQRNELLLGYTAVSKQEITSGIQRLAGVLGYW